MKVSMQQSWLKLKAEIKSRGWIVASCDQEVQIRTTNRFGESYPLTPPIPKAKAIGFLALTENPKAAVDKILEYSKKVLVQDLAYRGIVTRQATFHDPPPTAKALSEAARTVDNKGDREALLATFRQRLGNMEAK